MTAVMSDCGIYRYQLSREWLTGNGTVCWVMLNPSTADGVSDDPTIRKCVGFSHRWGYRRLIVVNLYAYRATDPKDLRRALTDGKDVVGPLNFSWICDAVDAAQCVVLAWGAHEPPGSDRVQEVVDTVRARGATPACLGVTRSGQPRHPLMVSYETPLVDWLVRECGPDRADGNRAE